MTDPPSTPRRLFRKAERGRDENTPWIVMGGVHLAVAVFVAIVIAAVFLVYYLVR